MDVNQGIEVKDAKQSVNLKRMELIAAWNVDIVKRKNNAIT